MFLMTSRNSLESRKRGRERGFKKSFSEKFNEDFPESDVMRSSTSGQWTQPLLIAECPGHVGVGQLPAVIDLVVSQTEENWTITDITDDARLDFESADGLF